MKIIKNLKLEQAIKLLQVDAVNKEYDWFKTHCKYLWNNGRQYIYKILLHTEDIKGLITNDNRGNKEKIKDIYRDILSNGYKENSLLFIRDLNETERGSFYVENGVHRARALQLYLRGSISIRLELVQAIFFSKDKLL